ncbi:tetratricopeptide repeat protein [Candidatus Amoebophilus asiaticus]|nr:SEL1-like repeat protein [Candidatus Amoebophilus asiaticus]
MCLYMRRIVLCILLIVASSSYQTCVTEVVNQRHGEGLIMNVTSRQDRKMEVYISLGARRNEAIIGNYRLRVRLFSTTERDATSFIDYINGAGRHERATNIDQPLSYFTREERINLESEEILIPFTFIPGLEVTNAKICFELFNEAGMLISSANVSWEHTIIEPENNLMLLESAEIHRMEELEALDVLPVNYGNTFTTLTGEHSHIKVGSKPQKELTTAFYLNNAKHKVTLREVENREKIDARLELEKMVIPARYNNMSNQELAKRANENDLYAQELMVRKVMAEGSFLSLLKLADPYNWKGIREKVQQDGRYIYILLSRPNQIKDDAICNLFVDSVIEHAQAGDSLVQTNLGMMYLAGKGVQINSDQGLACLIQATEKNFGLAYYMLGQVYKHGIGIKKNTKEVVKWHIEAANQGIIRSKYNLRDIYIASILFDKAEVEEEMDEEEGLKKEIEWLAKVADKEGDKNAQAALGLIYCIGKGVEQNVELGLEWLNMATDYRNKTLLSDHYLIKRIGDIYYYGMLGTAKDSKKAIELYIKAAEGGMVAAQKRLVKVYFKGEYVEQDFAQAIFWALQAKDKAWLLDKFEINLNNPLMYNQVKRDFEALGKDLLVSCRRMRAREKHSLIGRHADMLPDLFQGLKEIIDELMKWGQQLKSQSGLLINFMNFKDPSFKSIIQERQTETGVIPYVKEYEYQEKNYISFGESNVRFADQLLEEQVYQTHYNEALNLLEIITSIYKKAQVKLICEAKEIKKVLSKLHIDEKIKEQMFLKELNGKIRIINLFNVKLKLLEDKKKQFMSFYQLLFKQIEKGLFVRNKQFKAKHSYIFD